MSNHRKAPDFPVDPFVAAADARHKQLGMGYCKVCGGLLPKKDGTPHRGMCWCGGECEAKYTAIKFGLVKAAMPYWVFKRDGRVCLMEGCEKGAMEADHIVPLGMVDRTDQEAWRFWTADNMQSMCVAHHRTKTTGDVRHINAARKGIIPFVRWVDRASYNPMKPIQSQRTDQTLFQE